MDRQKLEIKYRNALELPKVLAMLAEKAESDEGKKRAISLVPQKGLKDVQTLQEQTRDAYKMALGHSTPMFAGLFNVEPALKRARAGGQLSFGELLKVERVLHRIRKLKAFRRNIDEIDEMETSLDDLFSSLEPFAELEKRIAETILSEDEMAEDASPTLSNIRRQKKLRAESVKKRLNEMIRSQKYTKLLQEAIVTQRNGRYVVPVRSENQGVVAGLVHDTSSSGATVFIEPMAVVEANNAIKVLEREELDEIRRILMELSALAGGAFDQITRSFSAGIELDIIFAKAQLGIEMKASEPILNDDGIVNLRKARHPLIDPTQVVAIDVRLGSDYDTLVITGPNTGGKTVSIKTIGLLTLMSMCGLMIPAGDRSKVSVFEYVLADIGDEQSIEQSLSTFSSHMTNIVSIMEIANDKTLVLIDELGAGTDPIEGAALAIAILEKLHTKGTKVAATTHYAEMKAYALETSRIENGACEFNVETLRPTYRLLIGVPGRSNAFAISTRLGMSSDVIHRANEFISSTDHSFESVLRRLDESRLEMEKAKEQAKLLEKNAREAKNKVDSLQKDIANQREVELNKARNDAQLIVDKAKREASTFLLELEKIQEESKTQDFVAQRVRRARGQVRKKMYELDGVVKQPETRTNEEKDEVLDGVIEVGDIVRIKGMAPPATVLEVAGRDNEIFVQIGSLKTRIKKDRLELIGKKEDIQSGGSVTQQVTSRASMRVVDEIHLRGKTADEALLDLDQYLDQAVLAGLESVRIVHGKGTGALREAVHIHIRRHPQVKKFRLGKYGEGEDGVTVATLK